MGAVLHGAVFESTRRDAAIDLWLPFTSWVLSRLWQEGRWAR